MPDDYDDEERALIEKHRAEKRAAAEQDRETWIRKGDSEASVPYSVARKFLQETFGIDLDEEPVQEPGEDKPKPKPAEGGEVKRFVSGRRVG